MDHRKFETKYIVEMVKLPFSARGKRAFTWQIRQRKTKVIIGRGAVTFTQQVKCVERVATLFGCNPDIEIIEAPGFRKNKKPIHIRG